MLPTSTNALLEALRGLGFNKPGVDGHIHTWFKEDLPAVVRPAIGVRPDLNQDFVLSDLSRVAQRNGFRYLVPVQARDPVDNALAEAKMLQEAWNQNQHVAGFVAGVDLTEGADVSCYLDKLCKHTGLRGVRSIAPENYGVGIFSSSRALEAATEIARRKLTLDVLFRCANNGQLTEVVEFLLLLGARHEEPIVIDHLGKPLGLKAGKPEKDWLDAMERLGKTGRFYVKLSALRGEAGQSADRRPFFPYYDALLQSFGPNRLIFGSDHPVSFDYVDCVLDLIEWFENRGLKGGQVNSFFHQNAVDAYRLRVQ